MTAHESTPELLALHAVRLKGMADNADVAARFDLNPDVSDDLLLDFEAYGWVTRVEFAGTGGWSLTESGRRENENRLARELEATGATQAVHDAYRRFLTHNTDLLRACTDWQLRPAPGDALAPNDHADVAWDQRALAALAQLGDELDKVSADLADRLVRFRGYDVRYRAALTRARNGKPAWVTRPRADSCHTVWMELHEDLLATLGIRRGAEPDETDGPLSAGGPC